MTLQSFRRQAISIGLLAGALAAHTSAQGLHVQSRPVFYNRPSADSICVTAFPFTVNRDDLDFRSDSGSRGLTARVFAELLVSDTAATVVSRLNTYFMVHVPDSVQARAKGVKVFNRIATGLKPGDYMANLTVLDVSSKREAILRFDTVRVPFPADRLSLRGSVFAYQIRYVGDSVDDQTARMVDNGYLVLPNPLGVYGMNDSVLNLYAEIYGLKYDSSIATKHRLGYSILDPVGAVVKDFGYQIKPTVGASQVVAQNLDIRGLGRGGFLLQVAVDDPAAGTADTVRLPFWHISSETDLNPSTSPFDSLTLSEKIAAMRYILTPPEIAALGALPTEGKSNFLSQYWKDHETVPTKLQSVTSSQLVDWFRFANRNFSTSAAGTDGWKSDRGRIYMSYGPPGDRAVEPHPFEGPAYEIWHYRVVKGGYYFVFVEQSMASDMHLVHSNAPGEKFDQTWENYFSTVLFRYR